MAWNDGLTGRALEIARTPNSPLRVMAGPGTGKSFALKRRLTRLLEEGSDANRILVVTFTRTASADLVREISGLGVQGCDDIVASTLHAYCFRLLMKQAVLQFSNRHPRPIVTILKSGILQFEGAPLIQDLGQAQQFGDKRLRTKRIRAYEANWARLQTEEPGWAQDAIDVEFEAQLLAWLKFHECMLIGELVPESLKYLRNNPASPECDAYDHVLVDEFQDLNKAEQVLIDVLAANGNQGIVGDEDQSIYSFRHAHPAGIRDFATTHPDTDDHILDQCRRCPRRVVAMADSLIRRNHPAGAPARLIDKPDNPPGNVVIVQFKTMEDESNGVAVYVQHLIEKKGLSAGEILVLTPRRMIGYAIRDKLVAAGISTHSFYHEEALEEDEAKKAFAQLTLSSNIRDRVALRFLLGSESPSWLANQYRTLRRHCEQNASHPWDVLEKIVAGELDIGRTIDLQKRFVAIKQAVSDTKDLKGLALIDHLFPDGDEPSKALREASLLILESEENVEVGQLLDELRTRITQPEMPEAGEFVRVMSLHKSKGLTSKAVIVCGCIEGLIPFRNDDESAVEQNRILQEQRRVFYVAITRCTEHLMLSSFLQLPSALAFKIGAKTQGSGKTVRTIASQFMPELGPASPAAINGAAAVQKWA